VQGYLLRGHVWRGQHSLLSRTRMLNRLSLPQLAIQPRVVRLADALPLAVGSLAFVRGHGGGGGGGGGGTTEKYLQWRNARHLPAFSKHPIRKGESQALAPAVLSAIRPALALSRLLVVALQLPRRIPTVSVGGRDIAAHMCIQAAGQRPRQSRTGPRRRGKRALRGGVAAHVRRLHTPKPRFSSPFCLPLSARLETHPHDAYKTDRGTHKQRIAGQICSPIHAKLILAVFCAVLLCLEPCRAILAHQRGADFAFLLQR